MQSCDCLLGHMAALVHATACQPRPGDVVRDTIQAKLVLRQMTAWQPMHAQLSQPAAVRSFWLLTAATKDASTVYMHYHAQVNEDWS